MGESAKAMIERFRNQKPLSREERQQANANKGVKEMWWITESEDEGGSQHQQGTEDIERPRPSPMMKPHLYPPTNSNIQNQHPRSSTDFHDTRSGGGSGSGVRDSDDSFLARLGLGRSSGDRARIRDRGSRDMTVGGSQEFLQPKYSRDFGRGGGPDHQHKPSIDELISEDLQFSNSIERLLNAYPKHPTSSSFDRDRHRASGGGGVGYRLRADQPSSSLDLHEGGTMKGLLLSLKLDGRSSVPDKATDGPRDQKEMSENLQAIIDSLHCLDQTTEEGAGTSGPGVAADNIQQVCTNLHTDMSSFAAIYEEKYANEDSAKEERQQRDEQMRLEGRREQLKDLQWNHCRTLLNGEKEQVQVQPDDDVADERNNTDTVGCEEMKIASPSLPLSHLPAATTTPAATALAESRLRAAWVGTESRPVWSSQLGKYVLPPDPTAAAAEQRRTTQIALEEESLRVPPSSFQPLFSSSAAAMHGVSSGYSSDLSHGCITRAARTAIETCLNATEQVLLIRLPEEEMKEAAETVTVLDETFLKSKIKSLTQPRPGLGDEEEKEERGEEQLESTEETKKEESTEEPTALTTTATTLVPPSAATTTETTSPTDMKEKLDRLDAILGHDDEAALRFLAARHEQHTSADSSSSPRKTPAVKFRSLEEIDNAVSSKPSLPPVPVYQHSFFEQQHNSANLNMADHRPQRHEAPTDTGVPALRFGGDSSRHSAGLSPRGSSPKPRGAVPHFLLHKAYPDDHEHDRNHHHHSPSPRSHPHSPRHHQQEQQQEQEQERQQGQQQMKPQEDRGRGGGRHQEHIINNDIINSTTQPTINMYTGNYNPSDHDIARFSNFHERTIFLEQMKRLRLEMTH